MRGHELPRGGRIPREPLFQAICPGCLTKYPGLRPQDWKDHVVFCYGNGKTFYLAPSEFFPQPEQDPDMPHPAAFLDEEPHELVYSVRVGPKVKLWGGKSPFVAKRIAIGRRDHATQTQSHLGGRS